MRSFPGLEKKGGGIQNVLFIHKSINEMSTHHRFRDAFFNYMATFLFRAIFFSDELEKPLRIKKYIYNKRQNSIGIVEMCCSNPFGCSIEALSSFCADDSVYVSMCNIRLSI